MYAMQIIVVTIIVRIKELNGQVTNPPIMKADPKNTRSNPVSTPTISSRRIINKPAAANISQSHKSKNPKVAVLFSILSLPLVDFFELL
jgi:hypothetical protein